MKRKRMRILSLFLALLLAFTSAGCGSAASDTENENINLYYLDADSLGITAVSYAPEATATQAETQELLNKLFSAPSDPDLKVLLPEEVTIKSSTLEKNVLHLDFSSAYSTMNKSREVLARAGIVRTLVQVPGIDYVKFTVEGEPIKKNGTVAVGLMDADTFIENSGKQINSYQHTSIDLFFTDSEGEMLCKESRSIYYSANKTLEWAIMERLIAGPKVEGHSPTIPSGTQIIGVSTSDGICYVNLSSEFVTGALQIAETLPIYSIVDSLTYNCSVKQVQIAIDGVTKMTFRSHMNLDKLYEKNTDLIKD